jgi:hypothetical protein
MGLGLLNCPSGCAWIAPLGFNLLLYDTHSEVPIGDLFGMYDTQSEVPIGDLFGISSENE